MLDRGHPDTVFDQRRAQHGLADQARIGRNVDGLLEVDATEGDTGILRGRSQGHIDLLAIV